MDFPGCKLFASESLPAEPAVRTWALLQEKVATCHLCLTQWPHDVEDPLHLDEIPPPPDDVRILFVGVAPTPVEGQNRGTHFYSSPRDPLRRDLFFVHAAKVRPRSKSAPPHECLRMCALTHLVSEVEFIRPKAVYLLGSTHLGPSLRRIFKLERRGDPAVRSVGLWSGPMVLGRQPVRGGKVECCETLRALLALSESQTHRARINSRREVL
jgi:hypothetical protein